MTCHGYANGCSCDGCARRWRSHNTVGIRDKEVRQFVTTHLTPYGWRRIDVTGGGTTGAGHPVFWHPEHSDEDDVVTLPSTPSGRSWSKRALSAARRINPDMRPTSRSKPDTVTPTTTLGPTREERLIDHAANLGVTLTAEQADTILTQHGRMKDARSFINKLVAAKRRTLRAA